MNTNYFTFALAVIACNANVQGSDSGQESAGPKNVRRLPLNTLDRQAIPCNAQSLAELLEMLKDLQKRQDEAQALQKKLR